jgi:tetratricopeptide (TPR) repeat protein
MDEGANGMGKARLMGLAAACALLANAPAADAGRKMTWTTQSAEAKRLVAQIQERIERFQFGPETGELARKIAAADPAFAMGHYYVAATTSGPESDQALAKAADLARKASDGERRFIDAMVVSSVDQGANFKDAIPGLEALAAEYPGERLFHMVLGQYHQFAGRGDKARPEFEKARAIADGPRVRSFLANDDLLKGRYAEARSAFQEIEKELPKGAVPFSIRYGTAFSYLYEGKADSALASLDSFLEEYRDSGASQGFPEVFIWNSIARINLENGRLEAAMQAYEKGYESVPGSSLPEDQKQTWLGRLRHGRCRVLARMGKHEEAWKEAEAVRKMIEEGGKPAEQFWPAYHYLAGYLKLEKGELESAVEHLKQADPGDPFHRLLLGRAYERLGKKQEAKQAYSEVVASTANGMERALAYPEAKRKITVL